MDREELIRKSDAIKAMKNLSEHYTDEGREWHVHIDFVLDELKKIPAAEPWELYNPDEWCQDCKEYDTENHRCPRWNKVIRKTLGENIVIDPDTIERGSETYIGEDIVVCHQEDYMDMMCKAMMWDEYGEEPKQGEWIDVWQDGACSWRGTCSNCRSTNDIPPPMLAKYCPSCGARMRGSDDAD